MVDLLAQCYWPELPDKYDSALRAAVKFILDHYNVSGIIASGTIIRGNPDPTSDLDIYVIHQEPFRQRVQRFFNQIPTEIFINPPSAVEGYFDEEQSSRRPVTAHMLATGFVVLDLDPVIHELREKAGSLLGQPPPAPEDLTIHKYFPALLLEDAVDVADKDQAAAQMILNQAVQGMLNFCFIQAGRFIPRQKNLLDVLEELDKGTAKLARSFYGASSIRMKVELAGLIADRTIEERGFFAWETSPETILQENI